MVFCLSSVPIPLLIRILETAEMCVLFAGDIHNSFVPAHAAFAVTVFLPLFLSLKCSSFKQREYYNVHLFLLNLLFISLSPQVVLVSLKFTMYPRLTL